MAGITEKKSRRTGVDVGERETGIVNDLRLIQLLAKASNGGMQSYDRLIILSYLLMQTSDVPGAVCEFGTYEGHTAALLAASMPNGKALRLYDSFEGLPDPSSQDLNVSPFIRGAMRTDASCVRLTFSDADLGCGIIHKAPVESLHEADLPESISFAHCDVDLYLPTLHVLNLIWPRISQGGIVVIDDVNHPHLPGVKMAVDKFLESQGALRMQQPFGLSGASLSAWIQKQ